MQLISCRDVLSVGIFVSTFICYHTIWQFLKLEDEIISINLTEYYIKDVKKILGILISAIKQE